MKTRMDPEESPERKDVPSSPMGPATGPSLMGPDAPPVSSLPAREPGIELYLGSGMATGFAYQGILKSLHEWKVKLNRIHAEEVGALVAVAYASAGNVNRMDWILTKFPENSFTNKTSGLLIREIEPVETRLEKRLAESFQKTADSDLKVPVSFRDVPDENLSLWERIRVSMGHPPILSTYKDHKKQNSENDLADVASGAKHKILTIEVKSAADTKILRHVPGQLLEVQIGIPAFSDDDFKRRSQAAFYGRNQIEKIKKEILAFLRPEDFR